MLITARFASRCPCGSNIRKGMNIEYSRSTRAVTGCPACMGSKDRAQPDYHDMAYEDQCSAACGLDSLSYRD